MVDYSKVPVSYMEDSVRRWVEDGVRPGSFLVALLANDLAMASVHADQTNLSNIREWALFLLNEMPDTMWGSYGVLEDWEAFKRK
jgi:hypothetical protein